MPANAAPGAGLIGDWVVADVDHVKVTDNTRLTVAFDETGRIYGSTGCNRYTGAYSYDAATNALKVTPLGVTRRLCPPALMAQEGRLVMSLQGATRVETLADGAISIGSDAGRTLLRRPSRSAGAPTPAASTVPSAPAPTVATAAAAPAPPPTVGPGSPAALPPPSTSNYALSGGPSDSPLTAPPPTVTPTPAPAYAPVLTASPAPAPRPSLPATASANAASALQPEPLPKTRPAPAATPTYALGPPAVSPRITAAGEIYFAEPATLPANATVRVQLRDVSRAGAPATVLGQQEFSAGGAQTYPFSVTAPTSVIAPSARLTLFAQVLAGNRLLFISDASNPVPASGASALRIRVVNASPAPIRPTAPAAASAAIGPASTSLPGTLPATPPSTAIPNSVSWRCGAETFGLAFEDQVAFLTTADGAVARLARIDASDEPGAPQMFSNSILTVIREPAAGRVRFSRGRMALTGCTKAD